MNNAKVINKIFNAVKKGDLKKLDKLNKIYNVAICFDEFGNTGLHTLASTMEIDTKTMKDIANYFTLVCNAQNKDGNTPLHIAAMTGNQNAFDILLDMDVKINLVNNNNEKPIDTTNAPYFQNILSSISMQETRGAIPADEMNSIKKESSRSLRYQRIIYRENSYKPAKKETFLSFKNEELDKNL
jgi:hypothetical protein